MKRNLRFYFALMFARGTALVLKLIGRKGTSMPGSWAIILCPDFIGRMPKPEKIIGITGTNGKTTVANMIEDVLEDNGIDFICNRSGTNVHTGIASTLIANSRFFGKPKHKLAVFEMDERSAPNFFPYMQPDILLCTNIFRDSYKRNAHAEFILDVLNREIPKGTRLVLNADDPLCSSIGPENERVYYGIDHLDTDKETCDNIVNDVPVCPKCFGPLVRDVVRYHHIGRVHCENCGYRSPEPDYRATDVDIAHMRMTVEKDGRADVYPLANANNINIYNSLAAVAMLREFGLTPEQIEKSFRKMGITKTRYSETVVGDKQIILQLAKGQNPIACSRVFENVRNMPGKKAVILILDDYFDSRRTVENTAWLYDTDFEFLNDESIVQVVIGGVRHQDTYVRALLAGILPERICHVREETETPKRVTLDVDTIFVLHDINAIRLAGTEIKRVLVKRVKEAASK